MEGLAASGKTTALKNLAINHENVMIINFEEDLPTDKYKHEFNK